MKIWTPFWPLLCLWGLTGCRSSSAPSLRGWSGSRDSRENGHPNAHSLFLNWGLCPITHDISSLSWALTAIVKTERVPSVRLPGPSQLPLPQPELSWVSWTAGISQHSGTKQEVARLSPSWREGARLPRSRTPSHGPLKASIRCLWI